MTDYDANNEACKQLRNLRTAGMPEIFMSIDFIGENAEALRTDLTIQVG